MVKALLALLGALNTLLSLWRDHQVRRGVEAGIEAETLRRQATARKVADDIDSTVTGGGLDALRGRMRRYQRD